MLCSCRSTEEKKGAYASMEGLSLVEKEVVQLMRQDNDFAQKVQEVVIQYMVNTIVDEWKRKKE